MTLIFNARQNEYRGSKGGIADFDQYGSPGGPREVFLN